MIHLLALMLSQTTLPTTAPVKIPLTIFYCARGPNGLCNSSVIVDVNALNISTTFSPRNPAPFIGFSSLGETGIQTPISRMLAATPACNYPIDPTSGFGTTKDWKNEPSRQLSMTLFPLSVLDLGSYTVTYTARAVYADAARNCVGGASDPCNRIISPSAACTFSTQSITETFILDNSLASAMPSFSPPNPKFGTAFSLKLNPGADPDMIPSGRVTGGWFLANRPTNATSNLIVDGTNMVSGLGVIGANATITFASDKDIGSWQFRAFVDDVVGERNFEFTPININIPNELPTLTLSGLRAPIAPATVPSYAAGDTIAVTATSLDPDGTPTNVDWIVEDAPTTASGIVKGMSLGQQISAGPTGTSSFLRNALPFVARGSSVGDMGHWKILVVATDNEGAKISASFEFDIVNAKPLLSLSTFSPVYYRTQYVNITATASDPDQGPVTVKWYVVKAPTGALIADGTLIHTGLDFMRFGGTFVATKFDYGIWNMKVVATDDENTSTEVIFSFSVENKPPRINFTPNIGVVRAKGSPFHHLDTAVTTDDDGGPLTFEWTLRQYPMIHPVLPAALGTTSGIDIPTSYDAVGTWVVRLKVTDDDEAPNSSISRDFVLTVDGDPTVAIVGPSQFGTWLGSMSLDAVAEDPDSPCDFVSDRCHHLSAGTPVNISPGIVSYIWYVEDAPIAMSDPPPWPLFRVIPGATGAGAHQDFNLSSLATPGVWKFKVVVTDGEGNESVAHHQLDVYPNTPPTLQFNSFASVETARTTALIDLNGRMQTSIIFDASNSYDTDNKFGTGQPGSGISAFEWVITSPPTCPLRTQVSNFSTFTISKGTILPSGCAGLWTGRIAVLDDDIPSSIDGTYFEFGITSCLQGICIAAPTTAQVAKIDRTQTPFRTSFWVDERLQDEPNFLASAFSIPQITQNNIVVRTLPEIDPRLISKGKFSTFEWDTLDANGNESPAGTYGVRVVLFDSQRFLTIATADEPNSIVLERLKIESSLTSLQLEEVESGGLKSFIVGASNAGAGFPNGSFDVRVEDLFGTALKTFAQVPGPVQSISWDGKLATGVLASPGNYLLRVKYFRNGLLAGEAVFPFVIFASKLLSNFVGYPGFAKPMVEPFLEFWNAPAITAANYPAARLKMSPLTIAASGAAEIRLKLEVGSDPIDFYDADTKVKVVMPKTFLPADFVAQKLTKNWLAHAPSMGNATIIMEYVKDGTILSTDKLKFRMGRQPVLAGAATGLFPFFLSDQSFQVTSTISTALDPARHRERIGAKANVYVLAHKTLAQWAASPKLLDVSGGFEAVTVSGTSIKDNVKTIWLSAKIVTADALVKSRPHQEFDVVYDFNSNGNLDPGDILNSGDLSTFSVDDWKIPSGVPAQVTYTGAGFTIPAGYNSWTAAHAGTPVVPHGLVVPPTTLVAGAKYPLVVFAHGMHVTKPIAAAAGIGMTVTPEDNYLGYRYLQTELANRGFASISIDLDTFYTRDPSSGGIRLRAWAILKNIEAFQDSADVAVKAISSLVDFSKIQLVGHSRGGDAVVDAQLLLSNAATRPAMSTLNSIGWNISAVFSVAPTSIHPLDGIPRVSIPGATRYMVVHGAADGDVEGNGPGIQPFMHYDSAKGNRVAARYFNVNHNFFNSSWANNDGTTSIIGPCDVSAAAACVVARAHNASSLILSRTESQNLLRSSLIPFLTLTNDQDFTRWFRVPERTLPEAKTLAPKLSAQSNLVGNVVDNFEPISPNPPDITKSSAGKNVASTFVAPNLPVESLMLDPSNSELDDFNRFNGNSFGVVLVWSADNAYTIELPMSDLRNTKAISFRVAQRPNGTCILQPALDLVVRLTDASMKLTSPLRWTSAAERVEDAKQTGPRPKPQIPPLPIPAPVCIQSASFRTVRIPIESFVTDDKTFEMGNVKYVSIVVGPAAGSASGAFAVDDMEIEQW
jgi:hypothetical protein